MLSQSLFRDEQERDTLLKFGKHPHRLSQLKQESFAMTPLTAQVATLTKKVNVLELAAAQQQLPNLFFDGDRRTFAEWTVRMKAALEDMTGETENQKIEFIMDHTQGRAFNRLRCRLPWNSPSRNDAFKTRGGDPRRRSPWNDGPDNAVFKTHVEVLDHLEKQFGDLDCQAYLESSGLKQKGDESFDRFLTNWEYWALSVDMNEKEMVADLHKRLNHWCRLSYLPCSFSELAMGCRKREWERRSPDLSAAIAFGTGLALLGGLYSDRTPE